MSKVREMKQDELNQVMTIWLSGNKSGHPFISEGYWESHYDEVKEMLPSSTVYVWESNREIKGFAGCLENGYLAGIFVNPKDQGKGIGHDLLTHIQAKYEVVSLHVYKKNEHAIAFYKQHGFLLQQEKLDEVTQEIELEFCYTR
ncbi:N-acetyltransferase [Vagococcus intermedius]|uniref:N-acetyltransferase n=1 Tax=Vagococcus intermedius TaxID=2991418 RepID=A0AAF0CVN5_9ENTE|nr:N-acetyltransferase [Vagococcus intermedius]WEG73835.1 N-acetyltransferase [Vagococcus intermedius]WEG75920.1 N-acetyltransferase [Vagococcus intermedius]